VETKSEDFKLAVEKSSFFQCEFIRTWTTGVGARQPNEATSGSPLTTVIGDCLTGRLIDFRRMLLMQSGRSERFETAHLHNLCLHRRTRTPGGVQVASFESIQILPIVPHSWTHSIEYGHSNVLCRAVSRKTQLPFLVFHFSWCLTNLTSRFL
jgi:hypothetical protein